jgi:hypothetical protein
LYRGIQGLRLDDFNGYGWLWGRPSVLEDLLRFQQNAWRQFARVALQSLEGFKYFAHGFWFRLGFDPVFILSAQRSREGVFWGDSSSSSDRNERGEIGLLLRTGGRSS